MADPQKLAQKALDLVWDRHIPVDPTQIAHKLVVKTKAANGVIRDCSIVVLEVAGTEIGGASTEVNFEESPEGPIYLCKYNRDEIIYRNRFAIAHEIGHIVLGHIRAGEPPVRRFQYTDDTQDMRQANAFAAALLMPERFLRSVFGSIRSVQQMGEAFGVSNAAAIYRLEKLRLI